MERIKETVVKGRPERRAEYKERIGRVRIRTLGDEVREDIKRLQAMKAWGTRR